MYSNSVRSKVILARVVFVSVLILLIYQAPVSGELRNNNDLKTTDDSQGSSNVQTAKLRLAVVHPSFRAPKFNPLQGDNKSSMCMNHKDRCTWENTFGGTLADKAYGIVPMSDDGVVVVGNTRSNGGFGNNAWIIRLNRAGDLVWEREFGGLNNDQVYGVVKTEDGGVVVAGHTRSRGAGKSDFWVFRLGHQGNLIWERTFGTLHNDRARTVAATPDGGFLVAGTTQTNDEQEIDAWLLKLDGEGRRIWDSTFGGTGNDGIYHLAVNPDGSIATAGYTALGGLAGYDVWVLRLSKQGKMVWERKLGRGVFDAATAIAATPEGGFLVVGVTSEDAFQKDDAWLLKLNGAGEVLWERIFGGAKPDTARSVLITPNNSYLVTISTSSYGAGSADAWLLHLGKDGTLKWDRFYGGKLWDRPTSAALSTDGGLYIIGYTTTKGMGHEDYWLLRLDANGLL